MLLVAAGRVNYRVALFAEAGRPDRTIRHAQDPNPRRHRCSAGQGESPLRIALSCSTEDGLTTVVGGQRAIRDHTVGRRGGVVFDYTRVNGEVAPHTANSLRLSQDLSVPCHPTSSTPTSRS
jgi:hypothetical protein